MAAGAWICARTLGPGLPLVRKGLTCGAYARDMASKRESGPDPDEITSWITTTYPGTVVATAMGATFFSLDEKHWPNFATIVTTDEHDMGNPSDMARPDVYRLNIGVGKTTLLATIMGHTRRSTPFSPTPSTRSSAGSRSSIRADRRSTRSSSR